MGRADRARSLIAEVAARLGDEVVLWRGPDLDGRDIDLLALAAVEPQLTGILAQAGLKARSEADGRTVWSGDDGEDPIVDVTPSHAWPRYYPALPGVVARASRPPGLPLVASPEDRLLIRAAEVVAGRPVAKALRQGEELLQEPEARARLAVVAEAERMPVLGELIVSPERLVSSERRGRMGYRQAAAVAFRSRAARRALAARLRARLARLVLLPPRRPAGRTVRLRRRRCGLLIAISGMDGAGKSTAAAAIQAHLEDLQVPSAISWARLGAGLGVLDSVAPLAKRLLRRQGTVADPVAAGQASGPKRQDAAERQGRRRAVSWMWILLVATVNARYLRRGIRRRRRGTTIVCDRWLVDSLVDLELRYGRHRFAEFLLSTALPDADLGILLHVDAATAYARNPHDQALRVLEDMERRYADVARRHGFVSVDTRLELEQVHSTLRRMVDALLAQSRPPARRHPPSSAQDRLAAAAVPPRPEASRGADARGDDRA